MSSTRLGYLAIINETTRAVGLTPDKFIRFKDGDMTLNQDVISNNPIQNNRWGSLNAVKGKITAEGSYNFDLDANESVHFIRNALGSITTTDVSSNTSAFKHVMDVSNTVPTFTLEQGKGDISDTSNNRQGYVVDRGFGCMVDTMTISASDGIIGGSVSLKLHGIFQKQNLLANATAGSSVALSLASTEALTTDDTLNIFDATPQSEIDAIASLTSSTVTIATLGNSYTTANDAKVELVPLTPSYGTPAEVFSFIHCGFQFGDDLTDAGSADEENVEDWELEFRNNLEERFGSLRASASVIAENSAGAMFKFNKYFESSKDRDRYLDLKKQACILTITNNKVIDSDDTNSTMYKMTFEMSDLRFKAYEMPTGTDELYAVSVEGELFYDQTDGRALRVTARNAKAGSVFA